MATEADQALRNNMVELNNWRRPMAQNINQVIGPKQVAQANDATTDFFTGQLTAGRASIRPQIIAWPYAADDDGCAFDQSNLWGVRFNAYNPEQNAVIAVPKTLPSGYTATVSRGGWQCAQNPFLSQPPDYTSSDSGATWSNNGTIFSVPNTRYFLRAPAGSDQIIKDWGPMNWANKSAAGGGVGFFDFYGTTGGTQINLGRLQSDHIGFRRIRVRWNYSGKGTVATAQPKIFIGYLPVGTGISYPTVPTVAYSEQVIWANLVVDSPTNSHYDIMVTVAQAPTLGTRVDWYVWAESTVGWISQWAITTTLSPRTDVPFPFDVVGLGNGATSDWHAPGGYV